MNALLEPLRLYLELNRGSGDIVAIDSGYSPDGRDAARFAPPMTSGLRPLVQALLPEYPDLAVLCEPAALLGLPKDAVVLLCLRPETLTGDGRWLDLHRQFLAERALRVILWCDGLLSAQLTEAAPHFADWIAHRLDCPVALRQPPPHAVLGLRALVRARAPGAIQLNPTLPEGAGAALAPWEGSGMLDPHRLLAAALPRWRAHRVREGAFADLLRQIQKARSAPEASMLCFYPDGDLALQRIRIALAESGWRRPCLVYLPVSTADAVRLSGYWHLPGQFLPLSLAIQRLSAAAHPGRLAVLLGLEPEAIDLCAQLLAAGQDGDALGVELAAAADPGAILAWRAVAGDQVDWDQVAQGWASPPLQRSLWDHPAARSRRGTGRRGAASPEWVQALRRVDAPMALRDAGGTLRASAPGVDWPRALVALRAGGVAGIQAMRRVAPTYTLSFLKEDEAVSKIAGGSDPFGSLDAPYVVFVMMLRVGDEGWHSLATWGLKQVLKEEIRGSLRGLYQGALAMQHQALGQFAEAEEGLRDWLRALDDPHAPREIGGTDKMDDSYLKGMARAECLTNLAGISLCADRPEEAEGLLRAALEALQPLVSESDPAIHGTRYVLRLAAEAQGKCPTDPAPASQEGIHLRLLHAPEDEAHAVELELVLGLLAGVTQVSRSTGEGGGDLLVPLLSVDLLALDPAVEALAQARTRGCQVQPVLLHPCDWPAVAPLADLVPLPADEGWTTVLRSFFARICARW